LRQQLYQLLQLWSCCARAEQLLELVIAAAEEYAGVAGAVQLLHLLRQDVQHCWICAAAALLAV